MTISSVDRPFRARRRASFVVLACLTVLLLFVAGCSGSETSASGASQKEEEAEAPTDRPNMILVLTDDLDFASAYRMPGIRSQLIEEGASFEETFVSHPTCCPSRATILTGLFDHNHDVRSNERPDGSFQKFYSEGLEENTIAVQLQETGYKTAFFGKYLNRYPGDEEPTHVPPGWDEWYGRLDENKFYDYKINENGKVVSYDNNTKNYHTDVLSGQATDFVRRAATEERPFFAYVAPTAPHDPATPAERHKGVFAEEAPRPPSFDEEDVSDKPSPINDAERISDEQASEIDERYRNRLESMLAVDEMVASLIKELEAAGELDNTFIFFTSDNGWHQGEHRIPFGKERIYEESIRVPLFVRGPGVPAGSEVEKLVLNTDFAPTFAELAGISFPADGRSLKPLLGGEEPSSWRSSVLLEKLPRLDSSGKEKGKAKGKVKGPGGREGPGRSHPFEAVRTETHKYVEYSNGDIELYDLEADPYELDNVYETADPSLVEDLRTKLDELRSCAGEGCREAELPTQSAVQWFFDLFEKS